ncbi:MAG TPA: hypothetical protein VFB21_06600 [Chthonomonadaceae bacterium]|nr:hypothetical protein [Chthonomonadaceae bacterium]
MEPDVQPVALYDFLYRDSNRIASYYAQIFSGRLSAIEETASERMSEDKGAKISAAVASGDLKHTSETQTGTKRVIDPHDVITTDVLSFLTEREQIQDNVTDAPHGALIVAQGTLVFVDRSIVELAVFAFEVMLKEEESKPKGQRNLLQIQSLRPVINFLQKLSIPSAFLLQMKDGTQVAGTIKEDGMQEPIAGYYFKHGTAGLADVYLIGIKELPSEAFQLPDSQFMGAGQQAAQLLSNMLFPPEALRVTPVAMFRKLF